MSERGTIDRAEEHRQLEHRLTKLESAAVAIQTQVAVSEANLSQQITGIDTRMEKHFEDDRVWQNNHDLRMAKEDGVVAGRKQALGWADRLFVMSPGLLGAAVLLYNTLK